MKENSNTLPRLTNNYVQVKNSVFDAWRETDLPGNTWKIYFVIYRQTIPWGKKYEQISRGEFKRKTGLCRNEITKSLQKLEQYNLIHRYRCTKKPKYMINQYVTTWKTSKNTPGKDYAPKRVYNHAPKKVHNKKDSSYSMILKKKKERKKPFSFSDLEKSKDQIEVDFFELFKDYPERTDCKKALEIFRAAVDHPRGINKIKIALECYLKKKKKPGSIFHGLGVWMEKWIDYYDMGKHEAECNKAAIAKQKEADIEAAAELKRIKKLPDLPQEFYDKEKRKNMPGTNWDARVNKK